MNFFQLAYKNIVTRLYLVIAKLRGINGGILRGLVKFSMSLAIALLQKNGHI
jgi:hypothetical protein